MNRDAPRFAMNSPAVAASPSSVGASSALSPTAASPLTTAPFTASRQEDTGAAHVVPAESVLSFRGLQYLPIRACERVNKINKVGRNQDRILVVTTTHLYTALPADGDVQRCISIAAISEVRVHKARLEVAVVMPAEYDLLMQCYDPASFLRVLAAISTAAATTGKAVKVVELSGPINFQEYSLEKPNQFARAPLPVATTVYAQLVAAPRRRDEQVSGLGGAVRAAGNVGAPNNSHLSFEKAIRQADAESGADTPPLVGRSASADRGGTETPEPGWTAMAAVECGPLEEPAAAVGASAKQQLDVGASQAAVLRKPMFEDFDSAETATLKRQEADGVASPHSASSGRNDKAAADTSTSSLLKGRMFGGGGGKRLDAAVPTGEASRQVPAASERVGRDAVSDVEAPLELFRLRTELAEARRDRDDMARGVAMLLRAKGEADAVMRAELDSLRLTIERLSAENLRLRRPWALDM
jgi:hypothetical protein